MASKYEKLKARMRGMRQKTERGVKNGLHAAETLVVGSAGAYAEGRMSDENGEWGFRGVPYLLMASAAVYVTGLVAGDRYSEDLFAVGTGLAGGHLFRRLYEQGVTAKSSTAGRTAGRTIPQMAPAPQRIPFGTAFDRVAA
jgi:hypothetical protein